jgi:two-component system, response regulator
MAKHIFLLHVEDNADDVELTRLAFKDIQFPYKVVSVGDGAQALEFLFGTGEFKGRDKRDTPALILLDLNLPKVQGLEVLRQLKADPVLKHVLVVVLTSSVEDKDKKRAEELGTNLYIQKPVSYDDFGAVVRQIADLMDARTQAHG